MRETEPASSHSGDNALRKTEEASFSVAAATLLDRALARSSAAASARKPEAQARSAERSPSRGSPSGTTPNPNTADEICQALAAMNATATPMTRACANLLPSKRARWIVAVSSLPGSGVMNPSVMVGAG